MSAEALFKYLGLLGKDSLTSVFMDGTGIPETLQSVIPKMPPDAVQISTTGKVGQRKSSKRWVFVRPL